MKRILPIIFITCSVILVVLTFLRFSLDDRSSALGKTKTLILGSDLKEISGLDYSKEHGLLAINDEKGIIFSLNHSNGKIKEKWSFGKPNDYEGLAIVGKYIFTITSSGDLYRYNTETGTSKKTETDLKQKNDIEGLCYFPADSSLLIAAKGQSLPDKNKKSYSSIFKYDISKQKLEKEVFLKIKIDEVEKILEKKIKGGFGTSGITVENNHIILVSHQSKSLLIYNSQKELKSAYNLNPNLYNQPEGITFINGKLLISNEKGDTKNASLVEHKKFNL